jgi:prefoldin subunit 5
VEDIEAFRLDRDGSANVAPLKKAELKAKWKDKANKLEAYSHLSPLGQFIKTLSQPDLSAWPGIVNKAMWAGELRAMYPHLTDAHEDELFNYMFKTGGSVEKMLKMTKEDLFQKVNDRANSIRFDPDEPLALTKVSTGYEARADTGPALARLKEIRKRIEQIDTLSKQTESKAARAELANEKAVLQREAEFIDKDIDFLKSAQNALFGIGEIMNRWETLGYLSIGE